jgi:hypothetical protein
MGASLTMIDRHYGHLARDEHAIQLLDERMAANVHGGRWWTLGGRHTSRTPSAPTTETAVEQGRNRSPLTDSNRRPPLYEEGPCVNWVGLCIAQSGRALRLGAVSWALSWTDFDGDRFRWFPLFS